MTEAPRPSVGELLKQGRLRQHLSISECAKRTHVSSRYLEALEEQRWSDLPSESHRVGFLKLYSQFLGLPMDEVMAAYKTSMQTPAPEVITPSGFTPQKKTPSKGWFPTSVGQVVGLVLIGLLITWGLYHTFSRNAYESKTTPWIRLRPLNNTRLVTTRPVVTNQKVRIVADSDSWIRVVDNHQLLYEGILPAQATKEWSGSGPYLLKISNVHAIHVFWNDQPIDVSQGAHSGMNDLQLPLNK